MTAFWANLPLAALSQTVSLRSELSAYHATPLSHLPKAPAHRMQDCRTAPVSETASQVVQAAGWQVIDTSPLGPYTLVTFAATSSPGPGGVCEFEETNLGVFQGDTLIGLFWSTETSQDVLGALEPQGPQNIVVTGSIFPVAPIAELIYDGSEILFKALAPILEECQGAAPVPQLWRAPLGEMREALLALGWSAQAPQAADPVAREMQGLGFPETESCSGTGVNYCSYHYTNGAATLRLITIGELSGPYQPMVSDFEITCLE